MAYYRRICSYMLVMGDPLVQRRSYVGRINISGSGYRTHQGRRNPHLRYMGHGQEQLPLLRRDSMG